MGIMASRALGQPAQPSWVREGGLRAQKRLLKIDIFMEDILVGASGSVFEELGDAVGSERLGIKMPKG